MIISFLPYISFNESMYSGTSNSNLVSVMTNFGLTAHTLLSNVFSALLGTNIYILLVYAGLKEPLHKV